MEKTFSIKSLSEIDLIARQILEYCSEKKKFALYGEMGVGKTTLIKTICCNLGVKNNMSSPTFSIINEYSNGNPVYHMDFYRLKNRKEALDIGAEEHFYDDNYCFIEWPQLAESILPDDFVRIEISVISEQERVIKITKHA